MNTLVSMALLVTAVLGQPTDEDLNRLLVEGRLRTDLGEFAAAYEAFETILRAKPTEELAGEALVRLGIAKRAAGDASASLDVFRRVKEEYGRHEPTIRLLTLSVGGVLPDESRWQSLWRSIRVDVIRTADGGVAPAIGWPGFDSDAGRPLNIGEPITLDVEGENLDSVLRTFADVNQMNIVVHPGVRGSVTARIFDVPWQQALQQVLRANGLSYRVGGNVIEIGNPGDVEELAGKDTAQYSPEVVSLDFREGDIHELFRLLADVARLNLVVEPGVEARVTLKLVEVPWDRALELMLNLFDLAAERNGNVIAIGRNGSGRN